MRAQDVFKEIVEAFHKPLGEILNPGGNERQLLSCSAAEKHDEAGSDPDHDHGVGDPREKGALKR